MQADPITTGRRGPFVLWNAVLFPAIELSTHGRLDDRVSQEDHQDRSKNVIRGLDLSLKPQLFWMLPHHPDSFDLHLLQNRWPLWYQMYQPRTWPVLIQSDPKPRIMIESPAGSDLLSPLCAAALKCVASFQSGGTRLETS